MDNTGRGTEKTCRYTEPESTTILLQKKKVVEQAIEALSRTLATRETGHRSAAEFHLAKVGARRARHGQGAA